MKAPLWTLAPGRCLMRDGVPVATLHRVKIAEQDHPDRASGDHTLSPAEMDELAREIVAALQVWSYAKSIGIAPR